ncbi:MAG: hypothetical protein JWP31_522 [Aeromicrobium sp.]|nr:hypothetical protein [Aeromicrobium sp.]
MRYGAAVRWDRLFDDLEAQASELELEERDALADELRDGDWGETSWRDLLGGSVVLEVRGIGRVDGEVELVNDALIHLRGEGVDHVVNTQAVTIVHATERRAAAPTAVESALGWGHVLRALRDAGEDVRVRLLDGTIRVGLVDVVGRDFVRLRAGSDQAAAAGPVQVVPFAQIAVVSGQR